MVSVHFQLYTVWKPLYKTHYRIISFPHRTSPFFCDNKIWPPNKYTLALPYQIGSQKNKNQYLDLLSQEAERVFLFDLHAKTHIL